MKNENYKKYLILCCVLVIAGLVRFWACNFGVPGKYRPDEEYLVSCALSFHNGNLNPHFFFYPSLYMYLLSALLAIQRYTGEFFGFFGSGGFHGYLERTWYSGAHVTGRYLTAAFGTLGVYATYLMGKRAYGIREGLISAAILAVNFVHVRDSHFATTDITMTTLSTFAFCAILEITRSPRTRHYFLAGMWTGLAISTKYTAVFLGFPFATAHFLHMIKERKNFLESRSWRDVIIGAGSVAFFFALTSPYFFLELETVRENFRYQSDFVNKGLMNIVMPYGWRWLIPFALYESAGPFVLGTAFIGIILSFVGLMQTKTKDKFAGILFFSFLLPMCLVLIRSKMVFLRYTLPLMPILALLAARTVCVIADHSEKKVWNTWIIILSVFLICVDPGLRAFYEVRLMSRKDTRNFASQWIQKHIPLGTAIRVFGFPYARPNLPSGYTYREENALDLRNEKDTIWFLHHEYPIKFYSPPLRSEFKELFSERASLEFETTPFSVAPTGNEAFDLADAFYLPIRGFSRFERPGPWIQIYRLENP